MRRLPFICVLILISCSNDTAVSPDYSPGWEPPVVKGIEIMDERGDYAGVWGFPSYPPGMPVTDQHPQNSGVVYIKSPYPNPFSGGSIHIEIALPSSANALAQITHARWVNEPSSKVKFNGGQLLFTAEGARAVKIFWDGSEEISGGIHRFTLPDGELSQGFYRLYIEANGVTRWRDIYVGYKCRQAPPGLARYMSCKDR